MQNVLSLVVQRWRAWDTPSKAGLMLAFLLLISATLAYGRAPAEWRTPILIGIGGLLLVIQIIFMWANRDMVTPFTRAQRLYLAGNFDEAQALLERGRSLDKADVAALTLLGNTYRQLGRLDESRTVLLEALDKRPEYHFPLYGFGRTLLAEGRYAEAAHALRRALDAGAPPGVHGDLGEALYRQGDHEGARAALRNAPEGDDAARALMTAYLLYRLEAGAFPAPALVAAGLPYWQAVAARFAHTPYGEAVAADVEQLQTSGGNTT
jgi:tetratricopeptide (TPR) repeat protein